MMSRSRVGPVIFPEYPDIEVMRPHTIETHGMLKNCHVDGLDGIVTVLDKSEKFKRATLTRWKETAEGALVRTCSQDGCANFILRTKENAGDHSISCNRCKKRRKALQRTMKSRFDYKRDLHHRVGEFAAWMREDFPNWNARKSRKKHDIVMNVVEDEDILRRQINLAGYRFHLHVDDFMEMEDDTFRMRVTLRDISPMFSEHFRGDGHRDDTSPERTD